MTLGLTRLLARDCSENAERRIETAQKKVLTLFGQVVCSLAFYPLIREFRSALDEPRYGTGSRGGAKSQSAQERFGVVEKIARDCYVIELIERHRCYR